ncbi:hypothetical protein C0991_002997 [Blastosporella zonata]|nr:hypothetical protein C0991_002997 [Blastosporella zonata]
MKEYTYTEEATSLEAKPLQTRLYNALCILRNPRFIGLNVQGHTGWLETPDCGQMYSERGQMPIHCAAHGGEYGTKIFDVYAVSSTTTHL